MAGLSATYVDADTFTVSGDRTTTFVVGRRVKADCGVDGYKFGTIETRSYDSTSNETTVNLTAASDDLTSNLNVVWYGIVGGGASDQSIPIHSHDGSEGSGGAQTILQVDRANITNVVTTTTVIDEASTPTSTSGAAFGSNAITLKKSNSTVRVQCIIPCDNDNDSGRTIAVISRSTTVLATSGAMAKKEGYRLIVFDFYDTPGSVGPHTYSIRVGVSQNTGYFNRTTSDATPYGGTAFVNNCWLTLTEIAA